MNLQSYVGSCKSTVPTNFSHELLTINSCQSYMNKISSVFQHIVSSFTSHHGNKPYSVPERCILHNVRWLINRNECSVWSKPLQTQQSGVSVVNRGLAIGLGYHSPPLSGTLDISWFCRCTSYCSQGSGFSHDWLEFIETSAVMIVALAITNHLIWVFFLIWNISNSLQNLMDNKGIR